MKFKSLGSAADRLAFLHSVQQKNERLLLQCTNTLRHSCMFTSSCKLKSDKRNINYVEVKPIVKYDDADVDKVNILADNRKKSGVYR